MCYLYSNKIYLADSLSSNSFTVCTMQQLFTTEFKFSIYLTDLLNDYLATPDTYCLEKWQSTFPCFKFLKTN